MNEPPRAPLTEVHSRHSAELMAIEGVVGTAESQLPDGRPCILVLIRENSPALRRAIPTEIEGWPVRIQVTGEIRAMPDSSR